MLFRAAFAVPAVRDYTSGYRAYRAACLQRAFVQLGDRFCSEPSFACSVDVLLTLAQLGAKFGEVPLQLRYERKAGASKMRVGQTILRTLRILVRHRRVGRASTDAGNARR